jgi:hypothetical protein
MIGMPYQNNDLPDKLYYWDKGLYTNIIVPEIPAIKVWPYHKLNFFTFFISAGIIERSLFSEMFQINCLEPKESKE